MYRKCWLSAILVLQILTSMDVTVCVIQYYTDQWALTQKRHVTNHYEVARVNAHGYCYGNSMRMRIAIVGTTWANAHKSMTNGQLWIRI